MQNETLNMKVILLIIVYFFPDYNARMFGSLFEIMSEIFRDLRIDISSELVTIIKYKL